jgi:putative membrane protein
MKTVNLSTRKIIFSILFSGSLLAVLLFISIAFKSPAPKLTDAQIAMIQVVDNQNDVSSAKMAKEKSNNAEVLKFADTMIKDHQSILNKVNSLCKKQKMTPMESDLSKKMNAEAASTKKMLRAKNGKDFDKAYIDSEVAEHKEGIKTIQNDLIPQTQNSELKALLVKVLPILNTHLAHAERVQKMLTK